MGDKYLATMCVQLSTSHFSWGVSGVAFHRGPGLLRSVSSRRWALAACLIKEKVASKCILHCSKHRGSALQQQFCQESFARSLELVPSIKAEQIVHGKQVNERKTTGRICTCMLLM